jgi:hypothetical protein
VRNDLACQHASHGLAERVVVRGKKHHHPYL